MSFFYVFLVLPVCVEEIGGNEEISKVNDIGNGKDDSFAGW